MTMGVISPAGSDDIGDIAVNVQGMQGVAESICRYRLSYILVHWPLFLIHHVTYNETKRRYNGNDALFQLSSR